ncbi:MAG TPA: S49 family peptidase [Polyangiaceae bacterium]|nr:S49 family peptidase [Polyangiaceae bacterium]
MKSSLALLVGLSLGCRAGESKDSAASKPHLAMIDLRAGLSESSEGGALLPTPATQTYTGLIRGAERWTKDANVAGVFVRMGSQTISLARAIELSEALGALRKAKKTVTCHAHSIDNGSAAFLRESCDELWLSAAGDVETVGIAAQLTYLKGALDKLGVQADMLAIGRYKSGAEALTREGPSEPAAENLTQMLGDLRGVWLAAATRGAGDRKAALERALEDGPHTPDAARELGLVDRIGYEDEALSAAKKQAGVSEVVTVFGPGAEGQSGGSVGSALRSLLGAERGGTSRPHVAVVPMVGSITVSGSGPFSEGGITSDAYVKLIKRLREDASVRAVVVRIESPGGSPLASDLIWHQLMLTRTVKPVVVSIAGMAASGGYYIACAADHIIASPSAIVGSIGVFGGKLVFGEALANLGITSRDFPANPDPALAKRPTHLSPLSPWDDATREKVRQSMQRIYDLFLERVAEGRHKRKEDIAPNAEGAIFLAERGKERGLVDEIGGLRRAIEVARERAKLDADAGVTVESSEGSWLESLLGGEASDDAIEAALARRITERAESRLLGTQGVVREQLEQFGSVLGPMAEGESVVAALPFAIRIR